MIWVIAGTLDGRNLAASVQEHSGEEVLVSVVSQYGAQLAEHPGITVHTGRLDESAMCDLIQDNNIRLLIDASHPYAAIVSETARAACTKAGIDYVRYERAEIPLPDYDKLYHAKDEFEAADLAGQLGKSILLNGNRFNGFGIYGIQVTFYTVDNGYRRLSAC